MKLYIGLKGFMRLEAWIDVIIVFVTLESLVVNMTRIPRSEWEERSKIHGEEG